MDDLPDFAAFDAAYERQLFGPLPDWPRPTSKARQQQPGRNRSAKRPSTKGPRANAKEFS
jgi:hypothetical protein